MGQLGEIEAMVAFHHEEARRGGRCHQAAEEAEHFRAAIHVEVVGRRAENQPRLQPQLRPAAEPKEAVGDDDFHLGFDAENGGGAAQGLGGGEMLFDECRPGGAATERLPGPAPVPANRSMACFPRTAVLRRLKTASRTRSFMGRVRGSPE